MTRKKAILLGHLNAGLKVAVCVLGPQRKPSISLQGGQPSGHTLALRTSRGNSTLAPEVSASCELVLIAP